MRLDRLDLDGPTKVEHDAERDLRELSLAGWLRTSRDRSLAEVRALRLGILGLAGRTVPLVWGTDPSLDGYWRVEDVDARVRASYADQAVLTWSAELTRVGRSHDTDVESRLTGADLVNAHAITGERWHAPAPAHEGYHVGDTVPGWVDRSSVHGDVRVYRSLPAGSDPLWGCEAGFFLDAASRLLVDGRIVAGDRAPDGSWQVDNAITRVLPTPSGFAVAAWDSNTWVEKGYVLRVSGDATGLDRSPTVLRNDPEEVAVRLTDSSAGRVSVDVVLRRGSRTVWLVVQRYASAQLRIERDPSEEAEAITGGIRAIKDDNDGNRYVVATSKSHSTSLTGGAITVLGETIADFAVGTELGGSQAQTGDTATDLVNQYVGARAEHTRMVRR